MDMSTAMHHVSTTMESTLALADHVTREHAPSLAEHARAAAESLGASASLVAVLLLATIVLFPIMYPLHCIIRGRRAQRYKDLLHVYTFANQKGGVGKTATTMLIAKRMAERHPDANVLVIDCSVFGDITGLMLSDPEGDPPAKAAELIRVGKSVEGKRGACAQALRAHSSWLPWLTSWISGGFKIRNHMANINSLGGDCERAPPNLFLMTNQMDEDMEFDESELSGKALSVVAQTIRANLAKKARDDGKKWIVLVDTDGGTKHTLTQLALCLADYIVVPTDADVKVIKRIKSMLRFVQSLRRSGWSTAEVGLVFFNMISHTNEGHPKPEAADLGLNWSPTSDATLAAMQRVVQKLVQLRSAFPDELKCVLDGARKDPTTRAERTFGGVRKGGKDAVLTFNSPWTTTTAGTIDGDVNSILDKMDMLFTRENLNGRFAAA